ncbi:unnamed protein product, partial [Urochloa humidicola]
EAARQAVRRRRHLGRSVHGERAVAGCRNGEGGEGAPTAASEPAPEEASTARPAASSATANAVAPP